MKTYQVAYKYSDDRYLTIVSVEAPSPRPALEKWYRETDPNIVSRAHAVRISYLGSIWTANVASPSLTRR